jgi:hypothetical protein
MGLMPDKPNPVRPSWAAPFNGTRRCTACLVRQPDTEFRWLQTGKRKASHCKCCEKRARIAGRARRLVAAA